MHTVSHPWVRPRHGLALFILVLSGGYLSGCVTAGVGAQNSVIRAKDVVAPALVHIRPVKEVYAQGKRREVLIVGSGFIISPDGYVVTNEHVAGESKTVRCVLSTKDEVDAEVIGVDPYTDLAVLKLDVGYPLPYVRFGDSSRLESGQTVIAMGSPHGLSRSVSKGIVSVTGRHLESQASQAPFTNWIQTDAAINPGNSGGPLVNLRGNVIGVNSMVLRGAQNVGFAIPSNLARQVTDSIIANGRVRRSWVGIDLQGMLARTDDPDVKGVIVAGIDPLSPAKEAGIRPGDLLIAIGGQPANARFEEDLPRIRQMIAELPIGEPISFRIHRGDTEQDIVITTEERGGLKGEQGEYKEWGFTASELTPAVVRRARLDSSKGVLVSGTQVGGIANNAGLARGDIILTVDSTEVVNLAQFTELYQERLESHQRRVLLSVRNRALSRYVLIIQEEEDSEGTDDEK
ncbi:MAG: trypsin-like peptidase domain-containing protein [Candidatus Hydrogenedentes bacterium]|nr:trypsin-like peptidase domain-containing protein [Candidatus Hydrogenedentota bacterium]